MSQRQLLQNQEYPLCVLLGGTGLREACGQAHVVCILLRSRPGHPLVSQASADALQLYRSHPGSVFQYRRSSIGALFACVVHLATEFGLLRPWLKRLISRSHSYSGHGAC